MRAVGTVSGVWPEGNEMRQEVQSQMTNKKQRDMRLSWFMGIDLFPYRQAAELTDFAKGLPVDFNHCNKYPYYLWRSELCFVSCS